MSDTEHQEKHFESYVLSKLEAQGWKVGKTLKYDTERALYPDDLVAWLETTQPEKWDKLSKDNGERTREVLMDRLAKALEKNGAVQVLRQGFSIAGCGHIDLSEAAPEDKRNADIQKRYAANILRVVPQLQYHPSRKLAIDLVLFINGIPVATIELKTDFTQSADAAMDQYRTDRLPYDPKTKRHEPLLTFKRGAVVHFAMSDSTIQMATKLDGANTFFLPFNQGNEGHAGNPARTDGEYPVAYFWEQVCQRDAWLRIFHSFVYVEKKDSVDLYGNWSKKETLIFPRFHQWSAVNDMIEDAKANGAGMSYLADHSAGSGKTSTIAWTAHDLVKLRRDNGEAVFSSVIIVTDRTVLDDQLQDAVKQIDHQFGVIAAIDRQKSSKSKSQQLSDAMLAGTPIIVVTIQTFPFAMEAIVTDKTLKGKNFAVIIDEAHNSQTGSTAAKLQTALAMSGSGKMATLSVEELLTEIQKSRARPTNISYFAFTGTPKHSTLMLFGRPADPTQPASKDNLPRAFHRYPMRQAIEEGFILDVLQGYVPYKTAFNLAKQVGDAKRVSGKAAKRALAQWMSLHPTNVTQKVQFIIEHFSRNVAHRLDGKAKAMVVTSSRAAAIRYKKSFDAYISKHEEYSGIRSLIAFSGKMTGKQVMHSDDEIKGDGTFLVDENEEFTEENMNPTVRGQDLRLAFDRPEYQIMLVADKFQTGFDQPKLVAMYVDKKIANDVEIVQTFSRLNRMAPGKDQIFIIDFVNEPESVRSAFAMYDDGAKIDDVQDLNVVYEVKEQLDDQDIYDDEDLERFKEARFKTIRDITRAQDPQHKALYAATEGPTRLFNQKLKMLRDAISTWEAAFEKAFREKDEAGMKSADHHRKEHADQIKTLMAFKAGLGRFCRTYAYVAQLIDFGDPELENFASFAKLLEKRLSGEIPENVDLKGLVLTGFEIKNREDGVQGDGESPVLQPIGPGGGTGAGDAPHFLSEIIDKLNHLFGDATPLRDQATFVNHIVSIARENDVVMAQIENNTRSQALKGNLPGAVQQGVVRALTSHQKLATLVLKSDRQAMSALTDVIYELIRDQRNIDVDAAGV
ncbi:type I restriction endonuclease subunit R [Actimicrobium sp. CCI2.3]|uniref:type I restriction endonuclease subunit R n=1 Tax=Actimicrobium sp. CCI2.3 TaxID=3048616 RepID=UPI002AB3475B|nr:DEAD/DEAH box helicase family protein [Actimicrobium sp. CCI2.3]MDY7576537.1 DEAD/DEAH box helicase family protein [Actimicrobium sp. CCI2.3]MEB0023809.1 DEAD/DEAH box helicase family protein [Actimicrobium sp. CCI2.3]